MAVKSLYFKNVTVNGALSLQDGGTAPTGALTTTGWTMAKLTTPNFSIMAVGTKKASGTFAATDALTTPAFTAASCWRSENPFNGTFANTNWSLAFRIRAGTASSQTGAVKVRIWKSTNADGTGATQLTSAILTGTTTAVLSTTASATSTATWTPGATTTFTNEYLWVQCEWSVVVASGSNNGDAVFYVESTGVITTPNFINKYLLTADKGTYTVSGKAADVDFDRQLNAATGSYLIDGGSTAVPIVTPWTEFNSYLSGNMVTENSAAGAQHYVRRDVNFITGDSYQYSIEYLPAGPNPRGLMIQASIASGGLSVAGSNTGVEVASANSANWTMNQHSVTSVGGGFYKILVKGTRQAAGGNGYFGVYLYTNTSTYNGLDNGSGVQFQNYKQLHFSVLSAESGSYGITGNDVTFSKTTAPKVLIAETGTYAIAGRDSNIDYGRCLIAAQGTYAVAGQDATLRYGRIALAAARGSYAITGNDATLSKTTAAPKALTADTGSYSTSGKSALLRFNHCVLAAQGIYAVAGKAATLQFAHKLIATQGAYSYSGKVAALTATRKLIAAQGAYAVAGKAATLTAIRKFSAAQGVYAVAGKDPILRYTSSTNVAVSIPYGITGQPAKLTATHKPLIAAQGAYSVIGRSAVRGYGLFLAQGSYATAGKAAFPRYGRIALAAASGTYASLGRSATLTQGHRLIASQGVYSVTGRSATLGHSYTLLLAKGSYAITGRQALRAYTLSLAQGVYAVGGKIVTTKVSRSLASAKGSYAIIGNLADIKKVGQYSFDLQYGPYAITGNAVKFIRTIKFLSNRGSYSLTGNAAGLRRGLKLDIAVGTYSIDGKDIILQKKYKFDAAKGTYVSIGNASTKIHEHNLIALSRAYTITGQPAGSKRRYQSAVASGVYSISENEADLIQVRHGNLTCDKGRITLSGSPVTFLLTNSRSDSYDIVGSPVTFIRTFHKYGAVIEGEHETKPTLVPQPIMTVGNLEHDHSSPVTLIKDEKVNVGNVETPPSISAKKVFG